MVISIENKCSLIKSALDIYPQSTFKPEAPGIIIIIIYAI